MAWDDMGAAWERHGMCELASAVSTPAPLNHHNLQHRHLAEDGSDGAVSSEIKSFKYFAACSAPTLHSSAEHPTRN
jgi:hypothetical protein